MSYTQKTLLPATIMSDLRDEKWSIRYKRWMDLVIKDADKPKSVIPLRIVEAPKDFSKNNED